jgi:hypothetical protein
MRSRSEDGEGVTCPKSRCSLSSWSRQRAEQVYAEPSTSPLTACQSNSKWEEQSTVLTLRCIWMQKRKSPEGLPRVYNHVEIY